MARSKKSKKMPVMFYQSIAKEDLEKKTSPKKSLDFGTRVNTRQKKVWLWSGVAVVMISLIFSWASFLTKQLKVQASGIDVEKELFQKSSNQLSTVIAEQQQATENIKKMLGDQIKTIAASSTIATSSATNTLSEKQIDELKNKIQKR